jgi:hypothetical protein
MSRIQRQIEQHRQGMACIQVRDRDDRPCPGVPVWVEQETHDFVFGCVAPDLGALGEVDRRRCGERLAEVFNRLVPAGQPTDRGVLRYDVPEGLPLGRVRVELEQFSDTGVPLEVHVRGRSVGRDTSAEERADAERVAALYTLCFAHPAVAGIIWHGFWDGEEGSEGGGLLRGDLAPRPAFHFLRKLIETGWHSRASGETDADGLFAFHGFLGEYRVAARLGEGTATTAFISCRRGGSEIRNERVRIPARFDGLTIADATGTRYTRRRAELGRSSD